MSILKKSNRTLLEVYTGVLLLLLPAMAVGMLLPQERLNITRADWMKSIGAAAVLTVLSYLHMYRCLDRALDCDEGNAQKLIFRGYLTRYAATAVLLILTAVTGWLNPLILCLSYLIFMKVAAYMQPYTHRFYNFIFQEKDPVPEPLVEEEREVKI